MTYRTWWFIAMISFLVSMITLAFGYAFREVAVGVYLVLVSCGFNASGWVLWLIGLINYLRWR